MISLSKRRARWFLVPALAFALGGCNDRGKLEGDRWGDDPGRPGRLGGVQRLDAAGSEPRGNRPADAGVSDGPAGATGADRPVDSGSGAASSDASPNGSGPEPGALSACERCEAQLCRDQNDYMGELAPRCFKDAGCRAVVDCVRRTKCAGPPSYDPALCYCGTATDTECLSTGPTGANGPCKEEIESAAEDSNPVNVRTRLFDLLYVPGVAMHLVVCDNSYCSTPCMGYPAGQNCLADPQANPVSWGNPLCESEACRREGACIPRSVCESERFGDCLPAPAGGSVLTDGGTSLPPDAGDLAMAPPDDGPPADRGAGDAKDSLDPDAGPTAWTSAACTACVSTNIELGVAEGCGQDTAECPGCQPTSGCDKMPANATTEDRRLCQAVLDCVRNSGCWIDLNSCLCGTAVDTACFTDANGACRAEILAATKSTTTITAGTLLLATEDPTRPGVIIPSGYAARLGSCYSEKCASSCSDQGGAGAQR